MKPSTKSKMSYNRNSYKRYEFNVRLDSLLNAIIEKYKQNPDNNLSELIRACLCNHFGIAWEDGDLLYPDYHYGANHDLIKNNGVDKFIVNEKPLF